MENTQMLSVSIAGAAYATLMSRASAHGFKTLSAYCRWLLEREAGAGDFTNLGDGTRALCTPTELGILRALAQKPQTLGEVSTAILRHYTSVLLTGRRMREKGWIEETELKYTGGRPAMVFKLGEAGAMRLDQETTRRQALQEKAEKSAAALRAASASAYPDAFKIKRNMKVDATLLGTADGLYDYLDAALTALYDWCDKHEKHLSDEAVMKRVTDAQASALYEEGDTWVKAAERVKRDGWAEVPEASDSKGEWIEVKP